MGIGRSILWTIFIYLLIKLVLIALGSVTGFLLHWLMPSVDLGMAILIGLVASGLAIHFFARISSMPLLSDDPEPEVLDPEPPIYIMPPLPPLTRQRRRKRR
jgi:hypothetical protein